MLVTIAFKEESIHVIRLTRQHERKENAVRAAEEAASYGSSTFMIYTGAPQNTRRKAIEEMNIDAGKAYMAEKGLTNIVVHAPYIINLGNTIKPEMFPLPSNF